jgi:hypothetical protein
MKRFLVILLDIISFGITFLIRMLVKKKFLRDQYHIDIDGDGDNDVTVTINEREYRKEE